MFINVISVIFSVSVKKKKISVIFSVIISYMDDITKLNDGIINGFH